MLNDCDFRALLQGLQPVDSTNPWSPCHSLPDSQGPALYETRTQKSAASLPHSSQGPGSDVTCSSRDQEPACTPSLSWASSDPQGDPTQDVAVGKGLQLVVEMDRLTQGACTCDMLGLVQALPIEGPTRSLLPTRDATAPNTRGAVPCGANIPVTEQELEGTPADHTEHANLGVAGARQLPAVAQTPAGATGDTGRVPTACARALGLACGGREG